MRKYLSIVNWIAMGIVKIRTVIQRPTLKHDGVAFLTDDGRGKWADTGQVRMFVRRRERHAIDVLGILFNTGIRDCQL